MDYEKNTWVTGDIITADKLNSHEVKVIPVADWDDEGEGIKYLAGTLIGQDLIDLLNDYTYFVLYDPIEKIYYYPMGLSNSNAGNNDLVFFVEFRRAADSETPTITTACIYKDNNNLISQ